VDEGNRFCQACGQEVGAPVITAPSTVGVISPAPVVQPQAYAPFGARFMAYTIDGLLIGLPSMIALFAAMFFFGGFGLLLHQVQPDANAVRAIVLSMYPIFGLGMLMILGLHWLYFAGMESSARQATIGKSMMSMRVADLEGRRISFGHATGRFFAKLVSGMIPFLIGYWMAAFTEKKQALHDLVAGTLVLRR